MNWKSLIKSVAPTIGTALGGPAAGMAVKFVADKLLGNPSASETEVADFVANATPETMLKLKELDKDFEIAMRELDIDVFELEVEDRKSAREMAKVNMWPQIVLSALFMTGYFAVMYALFSGEIVIPPGIKEMAAILVGIMTREIPTIMQFWFGSSLGSKEKTAQLKV